jgi:hypothetical protein
MWRSVGFVKTDVSEERAVSIFRAKEMSAEMLNGSWQTGDDAYFRNVGLY